MAFGALGRSTRQPLLCAERRARRIEVRDATVEVPSVSDLAVFVAQRVSPF